MVLLLHHSLLLFLTAAHQFHRQRLSDQDKYDAARSSTVMTMMTSATVPLDVDGPAGPLSSSSSVSSLSATAESRQQGQYTDLVAGILLLLRPLLYEEDTNGTKNCKPCVNPFDDEEHENDRDENEPDNQPSSRKNDKSLEAAAEAAFSSLGMLWSAGILPEEAMERMAEIPVVNMMG